LGEPWFVQLVGEPGIGKTRANRSCTRDAPTPTIASMNAEAEIEQNAGGRIQRPIPV